MNGLIKALAEGHVRLTFTSLSSGREIKDVYTLQGVNLPQNPQSDKLILRHVESNCYEDIEKNTIKGWSKVP
tara:strand:- start:996 stop:1211 length:216 start_codon:yes stop_codon:yes gene_type:complete